ncbi:hypothetical protein BH09MYX1_BH09MYX1_66060 [soil metagenome]
MDTTADKDSVEESLEKGVEAVAGGLKRGLRGAKRALEAPEGAAIESLIDGTNLPELDEADALRALAVRLDRDADLMRNLALRELTRVAWTDRVAQTAAVLGAIGNVALGVVAALSVLASGEHASERAILVGAASFALTSGAAIVWIVTRSQGQRASRLARDVLDRAQTTELRLEKLAHLLALRGADPKAFKVALAR